MGAYLSEKMKHALRLLAEDDTLTPYRAAQQAGISRSAISQNAAAQIIIQNRKEKRQNAK